MAGRIWGTLLGLWLWLLAPAAIAQAACLDISAVTQRADPWECLETLEDAEGSLSLAAALARPGWARARPRQMGARQARGAVWFKLSVANDGPQALTRWLEVGFLRLEHVDVYRVDERSLDVQASWMGGTSRALAEQPILGRQALFPVVLSPGEVAMFVVRVQTRNIYRPTVVLWEPLSYRSHEESLNLKQLVPISALLLLGLFLLAIGIAFRYCSFIYLAAWIALLALHEFAFQGYLYRYLWPQGGELVACAPLVLALLATLAGGVFFCKALCLRRLQPWNHLFGVFFTSGVCLVVAVSFADSFVVRQLCAYFFAIVFAFGWPAAMLAAWRHRLPELGWYLLPLLLHWMLLGLRLLALSGGAPELEPDNAELSLSLIAVSALLLMLALFRQYRRTTQDLQAAQRAAMQAKADQNLRLEWAVTERTQALEQALIAAKEAGRIQKEFLARLNHDLRSPLAAIMGYADLIVAGHWNHLEHGRAIQRSARRQAVLLEKLIHYVQEQSQVDVLRPEPTYLLSLLYGAARNAERQAHERGNTFRLKLNDALPAVIDVDAVRLCQILENMLANAAKAARLGRVELRVNALSLPGAGTPTRLVLAVHDTGPGIPQDRLGRLLAPFHGGHGLENRDATRLGLAIVRQWVRRMRGQVTVSSVVGQGTRLQVTIPVKPVKESAVSRKNLLLDDLPASDVDGTDCLVWIVEDSEAVREMLRAEIASLGFDVVVLSDGDEALTRIALPETARPHLILTDMAMPGSDGRKVLERARGRWPDIPVLLLTGTLGPAAGEADGFSAVLLKPASRAALRREMVQLLNLDKNAPGEKAEIAEAERPAADCLSAACGLARLGAMSELSEWAAQAALSCPPWRPFFEHLKALADQGDLNGCRLLLAGQRPLEQEVA